MKNILTALSNALREVNKMTITKFIIVATIVVLYIFHVPILNLFVKDTTPKDPTIVAINKAQLVNEVLDNLRIDMKAGRAYIYRFHNGVNYVDATNEHKMRTSMDYERPSNGVAFIGREMQDIPVTLFSDQLKAIRDERILGVSYENVPDISAKVAMKKFGSTHAAVLNYYDPDICQKVHEEDLTKHTDYCHSMFAIGVDWILQDSITFTPHHEEIFRAYVANIGDLLSGKITEPRPALYGAVRGNITKIEKDTFNITVRHLFDAWVVSSNKN